MGPPPLIYIAMVCIMHYAFSLRVYRWVHTTSFNHSFKHSMVKLCFLTIKYSSILKVIGLYTMPLSRKFPKVFTDALVKKYNLFPLYQLFFPK